MVRARRGEPHQAIGRPALVVQREEIDADAHNSVVVCLINGSSTRGGVCRVEIAGSSATGLERPSEIMVEKIVAIRGGRSGRLSAGRMSRHYKTWSGRCCCSSRSPEDRPTAAGVLSASSFAWRKGA